MGVEHLKVPLDEVLTVLLCVLTLGEETTLEDVVGDLDLGLTDQTFPSVDPSVDHDSWRRKGEGRRGTGIGNRDPEVTGGV